MQQRSRGEISWYTPAPRKMALLHWQLLTGITLSRLHQRELWLVGASLINLWEYNVLSKQVTKDTIHLHPLRPLQPSKPFWSVQIFSWGERCFRVQWTSGRPLCYRDLLSVEWLDNGTADFTNTGIDKGELQGQNCGLLLGKLLVSEERI